MDPPPRRAHGSDSPRSNAARARRHRRTGRCRRGERRAGRARVHAALERPAHRLRRPRDPRLPPRAAALPRRRPHDAAARPAADRRHDRGEGEPSEPSEPSDDDDDDDDDAARKDRRSSPLQRNRPIGGTTIEVARASESRERDDDAAARPGVVVSPSPHHHTSERATGNLAVVEQALSSLNTTNQPKETRGVGTTDDRHRPTRTTDPLRHNDANL